jgi:tetraacyldisaccharide 4'-kinase
LTSRLSAALQAQWWRPQVSLAMRLAQPASWLYQGLAAVHRRWHVWRRPGRLDLPVVVVGNMIVGGAGKTPTVIALVQWLAHEGWQPGVVSRGYGRSLDQSIVEVGPATTAAQAGDEPVLIHRRTGAPIVVARDRLDAVAALRERHPEVDIIVSDDGLQHHRLPRDVEVVVFDDRGAGNGLALPAGPLRQPLPPRLPARTLVLYNAAVPSTPLPGWLVRRQLAGAVSLDAWWAGQPATLAALLALRGKSVQAAAGMGEPERFFAMLEAAGLRIERLPLADHADFATLPWAPGDGDVVVTEKDAVKLRPGQVGGARVWVVELDFALVPDFLAALKQRLPAPPGQSASPSE